ncbi:DUF202 domain-containing protein [Mycolicibacterium parafortuitum]|uniref:DUF202 domain-containing protein n=1 Tax=Mycolicibacterium parafortuitum TaxID=39692 RepID=A0A375YD75_MYCPF|nr:DUF202 domain-containing protein [Mycolicibacterium parafortuitum]ORB31055.1 hypothetical protein BST38_07035 [Mycolicibacterium parafortuitum]SRX79082.1 hypothetical protein MPP7335_00815 [Mycolicibacterium parafortuitum]
MVVPEPAKPGLPVERTVLSWERSSLGFLAGGALLLLRQHGPLGPVRVGLAVGAAVLALLVLALGYRRSRAVRAGRDADGRPVVTEPHLEVMLIGSATVLFGAAIAVTVLVAFR